MTFTCSHCGLVQHHAVATCAALLLALPYVLSQTAANVCLPEAKSCDREQTQITHALCSVTNSPPTVCFIPANPHTHRWKREVCVYVCVCVVVVVGGGSHRSRDLVCVVTWTVLQGEQDKDCVRPLTAQASLPNCLPTLARGFFCGAAVSPFVNQMDPAEMRFGISELGQGNTLAANMSDVMLISVQEHHFQFCWFKGWCYCN